MTDCIITLERPLCGEKTSVRFGENYVVRKCANPSCSATFYRLSDGRLFVVEADEGRSRRLQYFWLCNCCCRTMTVAAKKGSQSVIVPLVHAQAAS